MKSRNLTQISLHNDPINRRMQGFSFQIDEDENWSSRCDFFLLPRLNYDLIHSMGAEMSQEYRETNSLRNGGENTENLMIDHGQLSPPRRTPFKETKLKCGRWMKRLLRWTVVIKRLFIESSRQFDDRLIASEGSGCDLVFDEEEHRFIVPIGSSLNDFNLIQGPSM